MAALMYKKSRLVRVRGPQGRHTFGATGLGEAEVVSARGRGSGGRGFISGAGETELQLQRRRFTHFIIFCPDSYIFFLCAFGRHVVCHLHPVGK
uniref:GTP-binding protein At3g49725ic n=1 Tax=Rhizophora mucronata TaxID=61149 RepID=A0A2P2LY00_RHIMU